MIQLKWSWQKTPSAAPPWKRRSGREVAELMRFSKTAGGQIRLSKTEEITMGKCGKLTEVYSRVCGYFRPISNWNKGKKEEYKERKNYDANKSKGVK
jgi:ribonucleoside-triphosphate reductase